MALKIKWRKRCLTSLDKILQHIEEDSPKAANDIAKEVEQIFQAILVHPHKFPVDKYKSLNNGSYRAFELKRIRFSYRIIENEIYVVRCRHTSRKPLYF